MFASAEASLDAEHSVDGGNLASLTTHAQLECIAEIYIVPGLSAPRIAHFTIRQSPVKPAYVLYPYESCNRTSI